MPNKPKALQLRSLADATRLRRAGAQASSAVVIGDVLIGCEAAASLVLQGVTVTTPRTQAAQPNRGR
jgi:3-phenylpropionate/trans-cinnamate dioxygenase ferredoxin reductase component